MFSHPVEDFLTGVIASLLPFVILGCHMSVTWVYLFLRTWETIDAHSGYAFPWSIWTFFPWLNVYSFLQFLSLSLSSLSPSPSLSSLFMLFFTKSFDSREDLCFTTIITVLMLAIMECYAFGYAFFSFFSFFVLLTLFRIGLWEQM